MMESVDKLRELAADINSTEIISHMDVAGTFGFHTEWLDSWYKAFDAACDAIERDVAERYMKLPVDADGVPIHVGDFLESSEYKGKKFPCRGLNFKVCDGGKRWTVCMSYDPYSGTSEYTSANRCRHAKPRTVEDVLFEMLDRNSDGIGLHFVAFVGHYADEIRELLEVDE